MPVRISGLPSQSIIYYKSMKHPINALKLPRSTPINALTPSRGILINQKNHKISKNKQIIQPSIFQTFFQMQKREDGCGILCNFNSYWTQLSDDQILHRLLRSDSTNDQFIQETQETKSCYLFRSQFYTIKPSLPRSIVVFSTNASLTTQNRKVFTCKLHQQSRGRSTVESMQLTLQKKQRAKLLFLLLLAAAAGGGGGGESLRAAQVGGAVMDDSGFGVISVRHQMRGTKKMLIQASSQMRSLPLFQSQWEKNQSGRWLDQKKTRMKMSALFGLMERLDMLLARFGPLEPTGCQVNNYKPPSV